MSPAAASSSPLPLLIRDAHGDSTPLDAPLLHACFSRAKASAIRWILPGLAATMGEREINTAMRVAHFLAQVGHESGELRWFEEIASGAAYEGRANLGNTHPGDGRRFKGRGLIQLTGRANYREFATAVDRPDVMQSPGLVASDPLLNAAAAGWYWATHHLNALADHDELTRITRAINGGTNGLDDRLRLLGCAKRALRARGLAV